VKQYYVYITASRSRRIYTGVTNNLIRRLYEHRSGTGSRFAYRYNMTRLVYFEIFENPSQSIDREKQIKGWLRQKKIDLIEAENPEWNDLSAEWSS
jgi:putative endonuclease